MLKRDYYILRSIICYNLRRPLLHFTAAFFRVTNYDTALLQFMAAVYYNLRQVYYILRWYYISCYSLLHFTSGITFYVSYYILRRNNESWLTPQTNQKT